MKKNTEEIYNALTNQFNELKEIFASYDSLFNYLKEITENIKESDYCDGDCDNCEIEEKEHIKTFEESTIGEKFIIFLLNRKLVKPTENLIEDVEKFIFDIPFIEFACVNSSMVREYLNELLNSIYEVDINKLRVRVK